MKSSSQSTTTSTTNLNTLTASSLLVNCPVSDSCPLLRQIIEEKDKEIALLVEEKQRLAEKLEQLTGTKNLYANMLFNRSSEKTPETETVSSPESPPASSNNDKTVPTSVDNSPEPAISQNNVRHLPQYPKRKRGAQPGHKGNGRKIPENLPVIQKIIRVPEEQRYCHICGKKHAEVPFTENLTLIDVKLEVFRVEYVRERLKRTCNCDDAGNRFVTAPHPPQVIKKCKYSHNMISLLVVLKYLFAIPLHRMLTILGMQGVEISSGSITGVFKRLKSLLEPLYQSLAAVSRQDKQWNIDETSWMSFIRQAGKNNFLAWMWVFASKRVMLYVQDPSRSSNVPLGHLGEKARGFVIADRFSAYGKLAKMVPGLVVAICWAHFRRDFINTGKSLTQLRPWAILWKKRIAEIYHLNRRRLDAYGDEQKFAEVQRELEKAIKKMEADIVAELEDPTLRWEQRKVLISAQKHWDGLTVFVRHHEVPMDNNKAERALRRVALGRKNYYGTYADWSGQFAAICLSILQTAVLHGLNPVAYLRYYLDACAKAGGVPEQLEQFHPWNIPADVRKEYDMQRKDDKLENESS